MGSDDLRAELLALIDISIHAPRMGSDVDTNFSVSAHAHFNPRSPDGERPLRIGQRGRPARISIHAPRMGSDWKPTNHSRSTSRFQSTLPGWGATHVRLVAPYRLPISIHAPRMGSDVAIWPYSSSETNFNPRSPDGERQLEGVLFGSGVVFQSTLPGWGATAKMDIFAHDMGKIIHFQH